MIRRIMNEYIVYFMNPLLFKAHFSFNLISSSLKERIILSFTSVSVVSIFIFWDKKVGISFVTGTSLLFDDEVLLELM